MKLFPIFQRGIIRGILEKYYSLTISYVLHLERKTYLKLIVVIFNGLFEEECLFKTRAFDSRTTIIGGRNGPPAHLLPHI